MLNYIIILAVEQGTSVFLLLLKGLYFDTQLPRTHIKLAWQTD